MKELALALTVSASFAFYVIGSVRLILWLCTFDWPDWVHAWLAATYAGATVVLVSVIGYHVDKGRGIRW